MKKILLLITFLAVLFTQNTAQAQNSITLHAGVTAKNVVQRPFGLNMNYLTDDDTYLLPAISTERALATMGVQMLRFPGGEKSDNYLWGQAPWTSANHTLASTGNCYWPNNDPRFAMPDFKNLKTSTLNFDEFMVIANRVGAKPLIVVNADGHFRSPGTCNSLPTYALLLQTAKEWVRYAKNHNYQIKHWMIGNETYNAGNGMNATVYKKIIIDFATAMKEVDPTIKIIVNGNNTAWWSTILSDPAVTSKIDYLGVSVYPMWNWTTGYNAFKNGNPSFTGPVTTASNAAKTYVTNAADKARIRIIATEVNSIDWGNTPWPNTNDVGHALVNFDMIGQQITHASLDYALFWNTRWIDNNKASPYANEVYDAISKTGSLKANGLAMSIWGNYLLDRIVATGNTAAIKCWPTASQDKLNIILLNKETSDQTVDLTVISFNNTGIAERVVYQGMSINDTNPTLTTAANVAAVTGSNNTKYRLTLPPASITVLTLHKPIIQSTLQVQKSQAGSWFNELLKGNLK